MEAAADDALPPPVAEAEGTVTTEPTESPEQAQSSGDFDKNPSAAAEELVPAEREAGDSAAGESTHMTSESDQPAPALEDTAEVPAGIQDAKTEESSPEGNGISPSDETANDTPQQDVSEAPQEQTPSDHLDLNKPNSEIAAEEGAAVQLLDPAGDSMQKPASLSSQSEESIRAYLDGTVVPVLRDGLRMLVKERPEDPCTYLVDYIKAHHP